MLSSLATATFEFATAAVILGVFTGVMVQALYHFGLLGPFQRRKVLQWIEQRSGPDHVHTKRLERTLVGPADRRTFYTLPYEQLCGQISTSLMNAVQHDPKSVIFEGFKVQHPEEEPDPDAVVFAVERNVDVLQVRLARLVRSLDYVLSIYVSVAVVAILAVSPNEFSAQAVGVPLYVSLILAASLVSPLVRRYLEARLRI